MVVIAAMGWSPNKVEVGDGDSDDGERVIEKFIGVFMVFLNFIVLRYSKRYRRETGCVENLEQFDLQIEASLIYFSAQIKYWQHTNTHHATIIIKS